MYFKVNTLMCCLFALLSMVSNSLGAQNSKAIQANEWGIGMGSMYYQGDLTPTINTKALVLSTRPAMFINYKKSYSPFFLVGFELGYGSLSFKDSLFNPSFSRNWNFNTQIFQTNIFFDFNLREFGKYYYKNKWTVYGKGGMGALVYAPRLDARTPLQSNEKLFDGVYFATQLMGGGGLKLRISYQHTVCIEGCLHYLFTDHIDGFDKDPVSFTDMMGSIRITFQFMDFWQSSIIR